MSQLSLQAGYRNTRIKQYWKCYAERAIMPSASPGSLIPSSAIA